MANLTPNAGPKGLKIALIASAIVLAGLLIYTISKWYKKKKAEQLLLATPTAKPPISAPHIAGENTSVVIAQTA